MELVAFHKPNLKTALTIAGSDSCSGAGIQLDLKIFNDLGVYGVCAVTAVTSQNTRGVQRINKVPPRVIASQIDSLSKDMDINACKIGMIYTPAAISIAADRIKKYNIPNVVLDTILASKDGTPFLTGSGIKRLCKFLIPIVRVITPNIPEAEVLSGIKIKSPADVKDAALKIYDMGCENVLIKGGHLEAEPVDYLYDGSDLTEIPGERIDGAPVHGTGCALSAVIAAKLAQGDTVLNASLFAKEYITKLIRSAVSLGKGSRLAIFD